jgi:hypothetical protein
MQLLARLDAIGQSLKVRGTARALIAFGSIGSELERIDQYSDLDFLVVAKDGKKYALIEDLGWLSDVHPVLYRYMHTADGWKVLYSDSILCDFGIVEFWELEHIPHTEGRIIWKEDGFDEQIRFSNVALFPETNRVRTKEWLLGEILTNIYVGLLRYRRGERLSGHKLIQSYALDRYLELIALFEKPAEGVRVDPFAPERRIERLYPGIEVRLEKILCGYSGTLNSARALLQDLDACIPVDPGIREAILALL